MKDATFKKKGTRGGKKIGATPETTQVVAPIAPSISEAVTGSTMVEEVEPHDFISLTQPSLPAVVKQIRSLGPSSAAIVSCPKDEEADQGHPLVCGGLHGQPDEEQWKCVHCQGPDGCGHL